MKRIGIVITKQESGLMSLPAAYSNFIANWGIPVPIFAYDRKVHTDIDLLILPGGADVDPVRYGQRPIFQSGNPNIQLEDWDRYMLQQYVDANIPIFGICRGFQTLNVHFGGTLTQHINQEYSEPRDKLVDTLVGSTDNFDNMFKYFDHIEAKVFKLKVNSLHHQGITKADRLGFNVKIIYTNSVFNNVEAFWVKDKPIVAVQWHPEEIYDDFSINIIRSMLYGKFAKN